MLRRCIAYTARAMICRMAFLQGRWRLFSLISRLSRWEGAECVGILSNSFKMDLALSDRIQRHMFYTGSYEPETTNIFTKLLTPGDVVVDIGANVGFYSLLAAHLVGCHGKVIAIEPDHQNYDRLNHNCALNGFCNIRCYNVAASDENGTADFSRSDNPTESGWGSLHGEGTKATVKTVRTDHLLGELGVGRVKLIKIDVEGAEMHALRGLKRVLGRDRKPIIICEVSPFLLLRAGSSSSELFDLLSGYGYRCYQIARRGRALVPFSYHDSGENSGPERCSNFVFRPQGTG